MRRQKAGGLVGRRPWGGRSRPRAGFRRADPGTGGSAGCGRRSSDTIDVDAPGAAPTAGGRRRRHGARSVAKPRRRRPPDPPVFRPSPMAHDDPIDRNARPAACLGSSRARPGPGRSRRSRRSRPPRSTYGRRPLGPQVMATTDSSRRRAPERCRWPPRGRLPRTTRRAASPGLGGRSAGRTARGGRSRPARAPAAAVSRAWFDQRRPTVTSVSAPSARPPR